MTRAILLKFHGFIEIRLNVRFGKEKRLMTAQEVGGIASLDGCKPAETYLAIVVVDL